MNRVMHLLETLAHASVEGFLHPEEVAAVVAALDADERLAALRAAALADDGGAASPGRTRDAVHEVPGLPAAEVARIFEPRGRVQIGDLPTPVRAILAAAVERSLPQLRSRFPTVTGLRGWTYVEYLPGQYITAHVDGIAPDRTTWPRQVAGIGVTVHPATEGGEFYVETTASDELWMPDGTSADPWAPPRWVREGADQSSEWFRTMARTRWVVSPAAGTAVVYGSQLTHGTLPVVRGVARKLLSWLIEERPA